MDSAIGDAPYEATEVPVSTGISPTDALNRFQPPDGFVATAVEAEERQLRYGFRIADLALLLQAGTGSEIVPMMPQATIPHGPAWLRGMFNLRGNLVPVCDLRGVLDVPPAVSNVKPMILVLDKGVRAVGFVIDGYPVALRALRRANQIPNLPEPLAQHVSAAFSTSDEVWLEFDHRAFLENAGKS